MTMQEMLDLVSSIVSMRDDATDEQALASPNIYPHWREGMSVTAGQRLLYKDVLYTVLQSHMTQADWTPDVAVSLYAKVLIVDDEIPEWVQPDSTNAYSKGDKVKHNGKTWESEYDHNVWEPGEFGWVEVPE